ncbi:MAG: hypothetical protein ACI88H_001937 [Cocleimonas sp.]|jgi:hypothetical protein
MDPQLPQLKDIHLPDTPDIWPLALGWWLLLLLTLGLVVWIFLKAKKQLNIKKHKRMLFDELAQLEKKLKDSPNKNHVAEANILLRRLALVYYPTKKVASLTGSDWLTFLDETGNTRNFTRGAGRILIDAPYRSGQLENYNGDEFIPLIRNWVTKTSHKVGGCL